MTAVMGTYFTVRRASSRAVARKDMKMVAAATVVSLSIARAGTHLAIQEHLNGKYLGTPAR